MSASERRTFHWTLISLVVIFCVVVPYWRHHRENTMLRQKVEAGQITEDQANSPYIKLGLDLAGGVDLLYRADPPPGSDKVTQQQMDGLVETIRRRIDPEGIKEPTVQQIGENRLNIQIPGETDPEHTKILVGKTALLQFIDAGDERWYEGDKVVMLQDGEEPLEDTDETAGEEVSEEALGEEETDVQERTSQTHYVSVSKKLLEGSSLKSATMGIGQYGGYQVDFEFDRAGGRIFGEHTAHNIGRYVAITLDGVVISSPVINTAIPHGRGYISGDFSLQEAKDLSTLLQSGSLPVPLTILQSRAIGPSLGKESINLSVRAAMIGLILVMLYMIIYYRLVGLMANLALTFYAFVFMGLVSAFGVTLTLPGIAGFILSLGMAVDANVIIFERIKEELNSGKTYRAAIEAGFQRAWPAILDSNVTTLITGLVLYMVGSGTIKGFAVTLNLGILISMFSALIVTRNLISIWSGLGSLQKPFLFGAGVTTQKSA